MHTDAITIVNRTLFISATPLLSYYISCYIILYYSLFVKFGHQQLRSIFVTLLRLYCYIFGALFLLLRFCNNFGALFVTFLIHDVCNIHCAPLLLHYCAVFVTKMIHHAFYVIVRRFCYSIAYHIAVCCKKLRFFGTPLPSAIDKSRKIVYTEIKYTRIGDKNG